MEKSPKIPGKSTIFFAEPHAEVFLVGDGQPPKIRGYAALYNVYSEDLGGFRTRIAPGAFDRVVPGDDVRLLVNHDTNLLLGRTKSVTLSLALDDRGLYFEGQPPATGFEQYIEAIRRGDMDGCSFSCDIDIDEWDFSGETPIRTINGISALYDVGPVTVPAFSQTSVAAFGLESARAAFDRSAEAAAARRRRLHLQWQWVSLGL